jgi:hypothetical protein
MYRILVLFLLIGSPAFSQSVLTTTLTAKQLCGLPQLMFQESIEYREQPLFGGETVITGIDDRLYWGNMMFTVNQENGFWTLFTFYSEDLVCITASGVGFTPIQ